MIYGKRAFQDQENVTSYIISDETVNTINEKGSYFISKYRNSGVPSISMLKKKDMNSAVYPGPGKY